MVEQSVRLALTDGFDPDSPSGEHRLTLQPGQLDFSKVDTEAQRRPVGRPRKRAVGEKRRPVYVSLEPEDRTRFEAIAERRGTRLGTLARAWILERLSAEEDS